MPLIETRRLRLREMNAEDRDEMAALLGDPRVMEYYPKAKDRAEASQWIARNRQSYAENGFGLWTVETLSGEFIGDCGLTWQIVNERPHLEVGYHIKASAQGNGYATEATLACRDHARRLDISHRLVAVIHRDNRSSQRVTEKIGMRPDSALRHASPVHEVFSLEL
jgi:RimJ/RimL family protein N-acetyltransferase